MDSGYATYRGVNGLYTHHTDTIGGMACWDLLGPIALQDGEPGPTYRRIEKLCAQEPSMVVTQNIDGLIWKLELGRTDVIELHGNGQRFLCEHCGRVEPASLELRECRACGCPLRPDVVFYGETVDGEHLQRARLFLKRCRVHTVYVIGTTLQFAYLDQLIQLASMRGAQIIHVNPDPEYREHSHRVKNKFTTMGVISKRVRRKRPHRLLRPEEFIQ